MNTDVTPDSVEQELIALESVIGRLRARQVTLLRDADAMQIPTRDGCATLKEWVAGRLDLQPSTAAELAHMARSEPSAPEWDLEAGDISFDRAAATKRLLNAGADEVTVDRAAVVAVHLVNRLVARQRRLTPADEAEVFERRRLWLQPNLARTLMTGTLTLSGVDAEHLLAALDERADQLSAPDDPLRGTVGQRRADALVSLATDHQTGTATSPRRPKAHVFIDADLAASTNGEAGALTTSGLQVGPNTLGEILCVGSHDVTLIGPGGVTALPTTGTSIPTRIRAFVRQRDGGCTADGCTSTYRLEPHHIIPRSQRGTPRRIGFGVNRITSGHHPDNLTLLCWFHHHVVIHQRRYTIDPQSPPGRRRFLPPNKSPPDSG